jgi:hypothetical protein
VCPGTVGESHGERRWWWQTAGAVPAALAAEDCHDLGLVSPQRLQKGRRDGLGRACDHWPAVGRKPQPDASEMGGRQGRGGAHSANPSGGMSPVTRGNP